MNSYKLVLVGRRPVSELSGYVVCASDEQARAAARSLLQFHVDHDSVYAYEGERLVCEIVRDRRKSATAG